MFVFGHLGVGSKLVSPWTRGLSFRAVLLGTILPDLIDKPIFYALVYVTGKSGTDLGIIAGPRAFGHTGIFLIALAGLAAIRRSRVLAAVAFGVASHLFLDNLFDTLLPDYGRSALMAMVWPFFGLNFAALEISSVTEHVGRAMRPLILGGEAVGLALLGWEFWKRTHERELLASASRLGRRLRFRRRRRSMTPDEET